MKNKRFSALTDEERMYKLNNRLYRRISNINAELAKECENDLLSFCQALKERGYLKDQLNIRLIQDELPIECVSQLKMEPVANDDLNRYKSGNMSIYLYEYEGRMETERGIYLCVY